MFGLWQNIDLFSIVYIPNPNFPQTCFLTTLLALINHHDEHDAQDENCLASWPRKDDLTSRSPQQEQTIDWDHILFNLFVPHSNSISMRKSKIPELPCSSFRQLVTFLDLDLEY